ncbi:hypothetical protein A3860_31145 [Niastella vici]|uniref:DUF4410 domain-containing protein n=1 Tax=Niastella vici TaxID=1703345 RepID=A0A1V9FTR0_9BACT|nr:hypothetical protein [Niastella vici]OQP61723.1 hypothetical protein A3860_31145 [Niastella vici]
MKLIALITLALLASNCFAQRYVIIDRKLKKPLRLADTITKAQMDKGFFAVEKQNTDTLIAKLELIRERLKQVAREKYDEVKWNVGSTLLTIRVVKWTYGDRLNVALSTDTGNGHDRAFYIVDSRYTNHDNAGYLKKLIAYIEKGKS